MKKQPHHDQKHQFEYTEEDNKITMEQINEAYMDGVVEQHEENIEKYEG